MWLSKQSLNDIVRKQDDLERRVKRLEVMILDEAENKIASLRNKKAGSEEIFSTIEEIINVPKEVRDQWKQDTQRNL